MLFPAIIRQFFIKVEILILMAKTFGAFEYPNRQVETSTSSIVNRWYCI